MDLFLKKPTNQYYSSFVRYHQMLPRLIHPFYLLFILISGLQPLQVWAQARKPDDSRFTKIVLDNDLNEPMEVAILRGTSWLGESP
jgi:hypothetical protein